MAIRAACALQVLSDRTTAVAGKPVPHHQQLSPHVARDAPQRVDQLLAMYWSQIAAEVEGPQDDLAMAESLFQVK
jgi:hypothetical protein